MNKWIEDIFKKRGIAGIDDLTPEEKVEFDKLSRMTKRLYELENNVVTVDGIVDFCKREKVALEKEWHDGADNSREKDLWIKAQHRTLDLIIKHIEPSKAEKDNIINYLEEKAK